MAERRVRARFGKKENARAMRVTILRAMATMADLDTLALAMPEATKTV
jgi:hypothetical protein